VKKEGRESQFICIHRGVQVLKHLIRPKDLKDQRGSKRKVGGGEKNARTPKKRLETADFLRELCTAVRQPEGAWKSPIVVPYG